MHVTEVGYRRVKNLGNYESEEAKATVNLVEGECENEAMLKAKHVVYTHLGLSTEEPKKQTKKKVAKKTTKKKVTKKDEGSRKPEDSGVRRTVSHDEVKEALKALWKKEGKDAAISILNPYGVRTSGELPEGKLLEVMEQVEGQLR